MAGDTPQARGTAGGYVLMLLVLVWSGGLSVGFAYAAASGELTGTRTAAFYGLAAFLGLISGRTGYELARRLRGKSSSPVPT